MLLLQFSFNEFLLGRCIHEKKQMSNSWESWTEKVSFKPTFCVILQHICLRILQQKTIIIGNSQFSLDHVIMIPDESIDKFKIVFQAKSDFIVKPDPADPINKGPMLIKKDSFFWFEDSGVFGNKAFFIASKSPSVSDKKQYTCIIPYTTGTKFDLTLNSAGHTVIDMECKTLSPNNQSSALDVIRWTFFDTQRWGYCLVTTDIDGRAHSIPMKQFTSGPF